MCQSSDSSGPRPWFAWCCKEDKEDSDDDDDDDDDHDEDESIHKGRLHDAAVLLLARCLELGVLEHEQQSIATVSTTPHLPDLSLRLGVVLLAAAAVAEARYTLV